MCAVAPFRCCLKPAARSGSAAAAALSTLALLQTGRVDQARAATPTLLCSRLNICSSRRSSSSSSVKARPDRSQQRRPVRPRKQEVKSPEANAGRPEVMAQSRIRELLFNPRSALSSVDVDWGEDVLSQATSKPADDLDPSVKFRQLMEKLTVVEGILGENWKQAPTESSSANLLSTVIDLDSLLFLLAHPNFGVLDIGQIQLLLHVLSNWNTAFRLDTSHYNLLLTHTLRNHIDGAIWDFKPEPSGSRGLPNEAKAVIPPETRNMAETLIADMKARNLSPDGLTYSFYVLLHKEDTIYVQDLFQRIHKAKIKLEPWAACIVIKCFSQAWRGIGARQSIYAYATKDAAIITHSPKSIPTPSGTPAPPRSSASSIWAPYVNARPENPAGNELLMYEALVEAFLWTNPPNVKALKKSKDKLLGGFAKKGWRLRTFEVALDSIAVMGTEAEMHRYLSKLRLRKHPLTRSVVNSGMKFWLFRQNPSAVVKNFVKYYTELGQSKQASYEYTKLEPSHESFLHVLEACRVYPNDGQISANLSRPLAFALDTLNGFIPAEQFVARIVEPILHRQLCSGSPLVGPGTWDTLMLFYAEVGEFNQVLRCYFELVDRLVPEWTKSSLYGFPQGGGGDVAVADATVPQQGPVDGDTLKEQLLTHLQRASRAAEPSSAPVLGLQALKAVVEAVAAQGSLDLLNQFCDAHLFSDEALTAHHRIGATVAATAEQTGDRSPYQPIYEAILRAWLVSAGNVDDTMRTWLATLRQREGARVKEVEQRLAKVGIPGVDSRVEK
ncbi:hypothetical protein DFJ73DRAFT_570930 [Zopfochytrium polystomum]|nr:hypothetical protein DFJ73DRAFT_570930 [Zopfochytrium polystomum]